MASPAVAHTRSCLCCKARKVKCDRKRPCSNCVHFRQECSFPQSPIRRNRASKKAGARVEKESSSNESPPPLVQVRLKTPATKATAHPLPTKSQGRLLVGEGGRSLFLAENAWASKDEIGASNALLTAAEDGAPLGMKLFNFSVETLDQAPTTSGPWLPTPVQLELCWHVFVENVDPMVRILHKPTLHKMVLDAQSRWFELLDTATQALLLSMCYSALRSIEPQRCRILFAEDAPRMEVLCRSSVEHALTRAGLIQTHDLQVLQAFTMFLLCARRTASTWTLVGLAVRIARSIGLHRDGTDFDLSPYEVEMRRRLWWELRLLDFRSSEDCGVPACMVVDSNTRMPLNIQDSDLEQSSSKAPAERDGLTEMSFSLLRYELSSALPALSREILDGAHIDDNETASQDSDSRFLEREKVLDEFNGRIRRKFKSLFDGGAQSPFFRLAAESSNMVLIKTRLQVHFQFARNMIKSRPGDGGKRDKSIGSENNALSDELFNLSTGLLERYVGLISDQDLAPWKWRVYSCTQWHAVVFVLSELCLRIDALASDHIQLPVSLLLLPDDLRRAWDVSERLFNERQNAGGLEDSTRKTLEPLKKLSQRVRSKLDLPDMDAPYFTQGLDRQSWPESSLGLLGQTDLASGDTFALDALDEDFSLPWPFSFGH